MLSRRLDRQFVDTDLLIVSESGRSIKDIIESEGWESFRKIEHEMVKKVCRAEKQVVATGGGVIINDANVKLMKETGNLIWLTAKAETISQRMMLDQNTDDFRPALSSKDSFSEIEDTLAKRKLNYENAMDFHVETDVKQIVEICEIIIRQLRKRLTAQNS